MTLYIDRSLTGTENDDALTYVETFVGDGNTDAYIRYTSLYGLSGDDHITVDDAPVVFIDGGDGEDIIDYAPASLDKAGTILGGAGDDIIRVSAWSIADSPRRVNGGAGTDTLETTGYSLDARGVRNVEKLVISRDIAVRGSLSGFDSVEVHGAIQFVAHADLTGVNFLPTNEAISIEGSSKGDRLDLSSQSNEFSIWAGYGDDVIIAGAAALTASGGPGIDFVQGGDGDDILDAGGRNKKPPADKFETVLGMGGDDTVTFYGEAGYFDGGDGIDTFVMDEAADNRVGLVTGTAVGFEILMLADDSTLYVDQDFFRGLDRINGTGAVGFLESVRITEMPKIQNRWLTLLGSDQRDVFDIKGSNSVITFYGGAGSDVFRGAEKAVNLYGEDGADRLSGGAAKDELYGGTGNDWLAGGGGNDSILGGNGNDTIFGGDGNDVINGGAGRDIVNGGDGNDWLVLTGLGARDQETLSGGDGNDNIFYGDFFEPNSTAIATMDKPATLTISGGKGKDTLTISGDLSNVSARGLEKLVFHDIITATPEFLDGFTQIETSVFMADRPEPWIYLASSGSWTWRGAGIDAVIVGSNGVDKLDFSGSGKVKQNIYLGGGNDVFHFGAGGIVSDMRVDGNEGNDTFFGGKGSDLFAGGEDHDTFVARGNGGVDFFDGFTATGDDSDIINLRGVADIENYKDLKKNHLKSYEGVYYIDMGAHGLLVLGDRSAVRDLSEDNFVF